MLRRRVTLALVALIVAMALLLRGLLWLADNWVEDAALADLMTHEMDFALRDPGAAAAGERSGALHFYRPARAGSPALPPALRALDPGVHEEVVIGGERWRVLVRDVEPGDRAYLTYLIEFVERRERVLAVLATVSMLLLLVSAWWLAQAIAGRALVPLDSLVTQIRRLDPGGRGQRLETSAVDRELQVIVDAINGYLTQLERLVERERSFAAAASHELRTPLAVIQGAAEVIRGATDAEKRAVERMRRSVREATEQIEAILALSRTRDAPTLSEIHLEEWLRTAAFSLLPEAPARARVHWDAQPASLIGPAGAARIVFGNLLKNALRSTPDGTVRVTVRRGCVTVDDTGPGVPPEILPRVFEPGFKGREGGSGMGLYIARAIAERYGWTLTLANREGGGARAEWTFPDRGAGAALPPAALE